MIYYYFDGEQERTFDNIDEARVNSITDGVQKFRDTMGGEYYN